MSKRTRQKLPAICVDEHIPARAAAAFRTVFRTFEVGNQKNLRGRDERDYLGMLYARNAIFVTSDVEFVESVRAGRATQAGVIYIPNRMLDDEKVLFAQFVGGFVQDGCHVSAFTFRNRILFAAYEGLRSMARGQTDELEFSWTWLSRMMEV